MQQDFHLIAAYLLDTSLLRIVLTEPNGSNTLVPTTVFLRGFFWLVHRTVESRPQSNLS